MGGLSKVNEFCLNWAIALSLHHKIGWLDIAMNNSHFVEYGHTLKNLFHQAHNLKSIKPDFSGEIFL